MLQKEKMSQAQASQKMWLELIEKFCAKLKGVDQADILPKMEQFATAFTNSSVDFNQVIGSMFDKWNNILDPKPSKDEAKDHEE